MLCALLRSSIPWRCLAIGAALAAAVAGRPDAAEPSLPAYNADIARTSVSGVSSGAYMAVQFGTAWSSIVKGVGAIAGGPFGWFRISGAQHVHGRRAGRRSGGADQAHRCMGPQREYR
jgi:poly(3-hydroxybutyrate) depolymerase